MGTKEGFTGYKRRNKAGHKVGNKGHRAGANVYRKVNKVNKEKHSNVYGKTLENTGEKAIVNKVNINLYIEYTARGTGR